MRTLLLDQSYFPVKIINWQKAMILLLTDRAEMVDQYNHIDIRSVNHCFKLPKVLRLFSRHKTKHQVRFTRYNVFWRDSWTCQYCSIKHPASKLTFDHLIPRSKGGGTSWENIVTCCRPCNVKKGNKSAEEAKMLPLKEPRKPSWSPHICLRMKEEDPEEWFNWLPQFSKSSA